MGAEEQCTDESRELRSRSRSRRRQSSFYRGQSQGTNYSKTLVQNRPDTLEAPKREPDYKMHVITSPSQAAIYRLSGDYNVRAGRGKCESGSERSKADGIIFATRSRCTSTRPLARMADWAG